MPKSERWRLILIGVLTWAAFCAIVSLFPYEYRDSDSSCYSSIAQKLARRPLGTWCAPEWWGHGYNQGLFRDHPPGLLWLPALLVRLGIKANVAALCANYMYILLALIFLFLLGRLWGSKTLGWAAVWGFVLTPIFLQYLVRANHEVPLFLAAVAGIYGLARSREAKRFGGLFTGALLFAVLIKGMSAFILTLLALAFWLFVRRDRTTFGWIVLAHAAALAGAGLFELWYRAETGTGFWKAYIAFQGGRSFLPAFDPLHKAANFGWYALRILWFSAPWIAFVLIEAVRGVRRGRGFFKDPALRFLLAGSLGIVLAFSLSDRLADRYIFPAYPLLAFAGIILLLKRRPGLEAWLGRLEPKLPVFLAAALTVLAAVRIFFHSHLYRFIRF